MTTDDPPFEDLSASQQQRLRDEAAVVSKLAFGYASAVLIAPPPGNAVMVSHASGILLRFDGHCYYATAHHVLREYRLRRCDFPQLLLHLASSNGSSPFDPEDRLAAEDEAADTVLFWVTEEEATKVGTYVAEQTAWPPSPPQRGDLVCIVGFPRAVRIDFSSTTRQFTAFSVETVVTDCSPRSFVCRFEREYWVTADPERDPPVFPHLGGMSGGPIFVHRGLRLELVGLISRHSDIGDLLIAGLLPDPLPQPPSTEA